LQSTYPVSSLSKILFSTIGGLRFSTVIFVTLVLSFGVSTIGPTTINTVSATLDSNASPENNTNSLVNNNGIDKQTVGSQMDDNSQNDKTAISSKAGSQVDPTMLPFSIPIDHSKKIKTNQDSSSQEKDNDNSHQINDNNNDKVSKGKDSRTTASNPSRLPFP
jgi:hypothetical protein